MKKRGKGRDWQIGDISQTPESETFVVVKVHPDGDVMTVLTERGYELLVRTEEMQSRKLNGFELFISHLINTPTMQYNER